MSRRLHTTATGSRRRRYPLFPTASDAEGHRRSNLPAQNAHQEAGHRVGTDGQPDLPAGSTGKGRVDPFKLAASSTAEDVQQTALFVWCALPDIRERYPELELLHHIPNGGSRDKREAGQLKAQGVKAGVSDLFLPVARHGLHGLYIEMKRSDGGEVSDKQTDWLAKVREQSYGGIVCYGFEQARQTLIAWFTPAAG